MRPHDELELNCPYCDSPVVVEADPEMAGQQFIEDCSVCCAPIELELHVDPDGSWQLSAKRDSD